jgi:ribosomal protein S18 acetylase RimI-like enzyme
VLEKIVADPASGKALVVFDDHGGIIASGILDIFASFEEKSARDGEIMGVYVSPKHQGLGIAKQIMSQLLSDAKEYNLRAVFLYARTKPAKNFYAKIGFRQILPDEYNGRVLMRLLNAASLEHALNG